MAVLTPIRFRRLLCRIGQAARRTGSVVAVALALCSLYLSPASAYADERQYKLEAAFLYNFLNYIEWPASADTPAGDPAQAPAGSNAREATICVAAGDPVTRYLDYVKRKMAGERVLTVSMRQPGDSLAGCRIYFTRNATPDITKNALLTGTLVVSDDEHYLENGGMIQLSHQDARMGMKINNSLLDTNGFKVSSRLLSLAQKVE